MAATMDVPESQRLIALSLGKIAASRGQKGGINLHKNLLVATVLTKARAAYMIQHMNAAKQRAAATPVVTASHPPPSSTCVEMKEAKPESSSSASATTTTTSTSPATSSPSSAAAGAAPPAHHSSTPAAPPSVTPLPEMASVPEGAAGSCMQVAESEDKENTPPPSPCRDAAPLSPSSPSSLDCEKRLQGEPCADVVKEGKPALGSRPVCASHGQQSGNNNTNTRDYVNRPSSTCCLLKRRRAMDRDHENVSAPKVRIVEARVSDSSSSSSTPGPEPMQCDSPQISNLVNIFNTGFSGLSGASSSGDVSVRNVVVGPSLLSSVSAHHKLSDNLTCAKEMSKVGLDSLHQPLVLSV